MFRKLLRRWKYGPDVIVVSGLPRSGTSMMMKMLEAGGLPVMTDGARAADEDNPKGYYELERIKHLETETDKAYLNEARGHAIKVISHLLRELPHENFYRVVFMRRDLDEVITSQNKMLTRRGEAEAVSDEKARTLYEKHLLHVRFLLHEQKNFELLEVPYRSALEQPSETARKVNQFLGGRLDTRKMAETVDRTLYRNQKAGS